MFQTFLLEFKIDNDDIELLWQFIRGDLNAQSFETWLYNNLNLEQQIGADFYLELISVDFRSNREVTRIRNKLEEYLYKASTLSCNCITLKDLTITGLGSEEYFKFQESFVTVKKNNMRYLGQCPKCNQFWLKACDSAWHDNIYLKRLSDKEAQDIINKNEWPKYFETFEDLIKIGNNVSSWSVGEHASSSLSQWVIGEVARDRPYIKLSEIIELLRINSKSAVRLCKEAMVEYKVYVKLPQECFATKFADFFTIYLTINCSKVKGLVRKIIAACRNNR